MNSTYTQPAINILLSDYPSLISIFIMICFMAEMMVCCACHYGILYFVHIIHIHIHTNENKDIKDIKDIKDEYIELSSISNISIYKDKEEEIKEYIDE